MDPITLIVTALAAGAAAEQRGAAVGQSGAAGPAVSAAYAGLRGLIAIRYPAAAPAVAQLEAQPASVGRRMVAEEDLGQTDAVRDVAVLTHALALVIAIQERAPETAGVIGVNLQGTISAGGDITIGGTTVQQFYQVAAAPRPAPPFQAPAPAADHVTRGAELAQIRAGLLDAAGQLLPHTVGLHGFGGSGKTVLARLACADPAVRAACADGILWVEVGKNPPDPRAMMEDLVAALMGGCHGCTTVNGARNQLQAALVGRKVLLVVDDVWNAGHVRDLLQATAGCTRLITTRNAFLLPAGTVAIELQTMRPADAAALLGAGLLGGSVQTASLPAGYAARLDALAARLGYWPVLLGLANRKTLFRIEKQGLAPIPALDAALNDLARKGVLAFEPKTLGPERDLAVTATMGASLELLGPDEGRRYAELAVFPPDAPIPLAAAAELWGLTGGLDHDAAKDLAESLDVLALLDYQAGTGVLRLHDVLRSYLYTTLGDPAALHSLLAGYWTDRPAATHGYAWRWLAYHRSLAAQHAPQPQRHALTESLVARVADPAWQQAHEDALQDLPALDEALQQALDAAVADDAPLGIPLLVRAADALIAFRREHQRAEPIFELARAGDLATARRRSALFQVDDHWRHALLLAAAWLAPGPAAAAARTLCDEVQADAGPDETLAHLVAWVRADLWANQPAPVFPSLVPPHEAHEALIEQLVRRVGGLAYHRELILAAGLDPDVEDPDPATRPAGPPPEGLYQGVTRGIHQGAAGGDTRASRNTTRYLAELDGPYLVAYAAQHPVEGLAALERYISVYGNYSYPEYRYSSLWLLLGYVTRYPRSDGREWVRDATGRILGAALGGPGVEFEQGLPIAVTALRARGNGLAARQALMDEAGRLIDRAVRLQAGGGAQDRGDSEGSDIWGHHKRLLLASAQAVGWLLGERGLADSLLGAAVNLADSGFAGFQAPACLALAEALRVCRPQDQAAIDAALESAQLAAHNVQDPTFCARMTARVNAMRDLWWPAFPVPDIWWPAFPVRQRYRLLPDAGWLPDFAARHRVGHTYPGRRTDALALPDWATPVTTTFAALERLYQRPLDDLLRLNGGDRPLVKGNEVAVPDPGFVPHIAARLAAELLAVTGQPAAASSPAAAGSPAAADPPITPAQALAWLRGLVPHAVLSPTALDAVLTRLVLAQARWQPPTEAAGAGALAGASAGALAGASAGALAGASAGALADALDAALAQRTAPEDPDPGSELLTRRPRGRLPG